MIAANNAHALAFDNASGLRVWLSDALCRLASGGSLAVRQLYSDDAEVLFEAARPMLLNGIEDVIGRPDLADRAIVLTLPPIGDAQRRPEAELWAEFEQARPGILGALLDVVAHGLTRRSGPASQVASAYGGFRALGGRVRNSALARWHYCAHLCRQSAGDDRRFHRR
jgi:hypothetical protein